MSGAVRLVVNPNPFRLGKFLGEIGESLRDWKPAWQALLPLVISEHVRTIQTQGQAFGASWPALTARWVQRKKSRAIGVFTGQLLAEMMSGGGRRSITKRRLRWGPTEPYAYVFNYGSERQPAREWMGPTPELEGKAEDIMVAHLEMAVSRAESALGGGG